MPCGYLSTYQNQNKYDYILKRKIQSSMKCNFTRLLNVLVFRIRKATSLYQNPNLLKWITFENDLHSAIPYYMIMKWQGIFSQDGHTIHHRNKNASAFLAGGYCTFTTPPLAFHESRIRKSICHSAFTQFITHAKMTRPFFCPYYLQRKSHNYLENIYFTKL